MGVLFNNIPQNIRVPFFYAEFQPGGTPYQSNARLLLIGQKLAAGTATDNVAVLMRDGIENLYFGEGSMLAEMYKYARAQAPVQEIWCLPVPDDGAGVAATGKITVANAPVSQAGSLSFYIAGKRVRLAVLTSDDNDAVAANIVAAINADKRLPVSAVVNGSNADEVDLTVKWKGASGNDILMDIGLIGEEGTLGHTLLTITQLSGGSADPEIDTALANLADEEFDWIASPYSDTTNLGHASDFLNDVNGRWSYASQLYGHYITAKTGALGTLSAFGTARNNPHETIMACNKFRSPPWLVASAVGAKAARHLQEPGSSAEISRPLQGLILEDIVGPLDIADRLQLSEKNTLLYDGISACGFQRTGDVHMERVITTYQTNAWGDADATYLDVNTLAQSMYGIRYLRQKVTNTHGRKGLVDNNVKGNPGLVDPKQLHETIVHGYHDLVGLGAFEDSKTFARDLVVERDSVDANRVNVSMPLDHVNQLRIMAVAAVNYMQRSAPRDELAA